MLAEKARGRQREREESGRQLAASEKEKDSQKGKEAAKGKRNEKEREKVKEREKKREAESAKKKEKEAKRKAAQEKERRKASSSSSSEEENSDNDKDKGKKKKSAKKSAKKHKKRSKKDVSSSDDSDSSSEDGSDSSSSSSSSSSETSSEEDKRGKKRKKSKKFSLVERIMLSQQKTLNQMLGKKKRYDEDEDCMVLGNLMPDRKTVILSFKKGKDDGKDVLAKKLRAKLRPVNSAPSEHYAMYERVDRPVLDGWESDHFGVNAVNPKVTCALHDKGAKMTIKMFHKENKSTADHKTALRIHHDPSKVDGVAGALETVWHEPQDVYSVINSVFAYCISEHRIRNHSYVPLLLLKCLHELRFFCGIAETDAKQVEYLTEYVNLVLDKNSQRGGARKPPLDYTEMMKLGDFLCHEKRKSTVDLYLKDPYTGGRSSLLRAGGAGGTEGAGGAGAKRIKDLENEISNLKTGRRRQAGAVGGASAGGGSGGQAPAGGPRTWSAQEKVASTCDDFASGRSCTR